MSCSGQDLPPPPQGELYTCQTSLGPIVAGTDVVTANAPRRHTAKRIIAAGSIRRLAPNRPEKSDQQQKANQPTDCSDDALRGHSLPLRFAGSSFAFAIRFSVSSNTASSSLAPALRAASMKRCD